MLFFFLDVDPWVKIHIFILRSLIFLNCVIELINCSLFNVQNLFLECLWHFVHVDLDALSLTIYGLDHIGILVKVEERAWIRNCLEFFCLLRQCHSNVSNPLRIHNEIILDWYFAFTNLCVKRLESKWSVIVVWLQVILIETKMGTLSVEVHTNR